MTVTRGDSGDITVRLSFREAFDLLPFLRWGKAHHDYEPRGRALCEAIEGVLFPKQPDEVPNVSEGPRVIWSSDEPSGERQEAKGGFSFRVGRALRHVLLGRAGR